ncbi:MAG TPA: PHP domain-containing protein, partial [Lachnospiraceae bacterium]|nr:PHP domain-containing protein [Lachnospiraceae bacterium]
GIEFSTEYQGRDIHIVGLYIDHHCKTFLEQITVFQYSRVNRNIKMCNNLAEAGIDITYDKLIKEFPDSVITRSHYAKYLLAHGYIRNLKEAFDRYIGDRCKYFVPREKITPAQAVRLILDCNGIPVLAHPVLYHMSNANLEQMVCELKAAGLIGIEAVYSTYAPAEEREMKRLAARHSLCISGGSDFHGNAKPGLDLATGYGKLFIPEEILTHLMERKAYVL